ncbi:MAG: hypothetical protein J0L72_10750 [Armatimonadetes bacterium]|nr:hypothetical protein [Armatimonadota bacterium]
MKGKRITVRFSDEEYKAIEKAAGLLDMQVSSFARYAIQECLEGRTEARRLLATDCIRASNSALQAYNHLENALRRLNIPKPPG